MGLKRCDKCDEMVDEAKAFCPGCGTAFVEEEQRQETSSFEKLDNTVQLGNTMYNQMLSDMGLNISKAPVKPEKRIEVIAPIETATAANDEPKDATRPPAKASGTIWIVLGVVGLLILLPVALASAVFLVRDLLSRF
jgi:hypothetical protein